MKWFKHISDSLDDPFIFELMDEFGADGYLVFFGTLEIYSREFSPKDDWKLSITWSYLRQKLRISRPKLQKILSKIYKWEVSFTNTHLIIFIPKFKELIDNWTLRQIPKTTEQLQSNNAETTQPIRIKNKKKNKNKEYSLEFEGFYSLYPNKKDKPEAYKAWQKRNGSLPAIEEILKAVQNQINWRKNANGEFRPGWKNPATWLNKGSWTDELKSGGNNGTGVNTSQRNYGTNRELSQETNAEADEINRKYYAAKQAAADGQPKENAGRDS